MNFKISDFCITDTPVPVAIIDKIFLHHLLIGQAIRDALGFAIWPSLKSSYRSVPYELKHGRTGNSEHCFKGLGATDWTTHKKNLLKLLEQLKKSAYVRVCYYPNEGFIHCDYKGSERLFFICEDGVNWIRQDEKR